MTYVWSRLSLQVLIFLVYFFLFIDDVDIIFDFFNSDKVILVNIIRKVWTHSEVFIGIIKPTKANFYLFCPADGSPGPGETGQQTPE